LVLLGDWIEALLSTYAVPTAKFALLFELETPAAKGIITPAK